MTMMRRVCWAFCCCLLISLPARAQPASDAHREAPFASFQAFKDALSALAANAGSADHARRVDAFWNTVTQARQVPFVQGDSVAFLYRGPADRVAWNGDFNGWGSDPSLPTEGFRLAHTDIWLLEYIFPPDARIDYKIVLDGKEWILDPDNPRQQWSGFGPNSELPMPAYVYPPETVAHADRPHGTLTGPIRINSARLGYAVDYRVYKPAGYDTLARLPTVYVTDGHEYADDRLGGMPAVLDNVIAEGILPPVLAVFVDPRDPNDPSANRRQRQYADDYDTFAAFLNDELVPTIDRTYKTDPTAERRGILGTSLGGMFSAYLGAAYPAVFGCIGMHSPAFRYDTERNQDRIFRMYSEAERLPLTIFMSTGTLHDVQDGARRMAQVLEGKGYTLQYREVNEGHSWGNWRALIDDALRFCWNPEIEVGTDKP